MVRITGHIALQKNTTGFGDNNFGSILQKMNLKHYTNYGFIFT